MSRFYIYTWCNFSLYTDSFCTRSLRTQLQNYAGFDDKFYAGNGLEFWMALVTSSTGFEEDLTTWRDGGGIGSFGFFEKI